MLRASLFSALFLIAVAGAQAEELSWAKAPEVRVAPPSGQEEFLPERHPRRRARESTH